MAVTKLKIIVIATCYPSKGSPGKGIFSHQVVKSLQNLGCECHVMMPVNWFPPLGMHNFHPHWKRGHDALETMYEELEGVKIHHPRVFMRMPSRLFPNTDYWRLMGLAIAKYCKSHKELRNADLIFSHFVCTEGYSGVFVKQALKIPHVSFALGDDIHAWPEQNKRLASNLTKVLEMADLLVANSRNLAKDTEAWMAKGAFKPVHTVYHGINHEMFKPIGNTDSLLHKHGLDPAFKYTCCIATGTYLKGWNELLDAIVALRHRMQGRKVLCISPRNDNGYVLEDEIVNRGLGDICIKLGQMPHSEIVEYLQIADSFILPSYNEGLSNSVLEAMAAAKVVITTDVGGHAEMVSKETGILLQPKSTEEVIRGLNQFLDMSTEERLQMGKKARERMVNLGDYDHNAALLLDLFKQIKK